MDLDKTKSEIEDITGRPVIIDLIDSNPRPGGEHVLRISLGMPDFTGTVHVYEYIKSTTLVDLLLRDKC